MNITRVGVDIAKSVFHIHAVDRHGSLVWQAKLKRSEWLTALTDRIVPAAFDGFIEHSKRVSSTCLITFEHNRYSVPASFANRAVSLRVYPERLVIVAEARVIAEHVRVFNRDKSTPGQTVYEWRPGDGRHCPLRQTPEDPP